MYTFIQYRPNVWTFFFFSLLSTQQIDTEDIKNMIKIFAILQQMKTCCEYALAAKVVIFKNLNMKHALFDTCIVASIIQVCSYVALHANSEKL